MEIGYNKWLIIEKLLQSKIWNGVQMELKYVLHIKMDMWLLEEYKEIEDGANSIILKYLWYAGHLALKNF